MSTYQDLIPGACQKIAREGPSAGIPRDLHTRTSYEHPRRIFTQAPRQSTFKILMRGPWGGIQRSLQKIFTQVSIRDHVRTPPRGLHQDPWKSFPQGPVQDHAKASGQRVTRISPRSAQGIDQQTLTKIFMPGAQGESHDHYTRTCSCWRGSCKILLRRASHKCFHTSTSKTWHLQDLHASTSQRGSPKDPL